MRTLTAYVEYDPDTQLYVGIVPDVPGAHSIGKTIEELHQNLKEVLELLEEEGALPEDITDIVGLILVRGYEATALNFARFSPVL